MAALLLFLLVFKLVPALVGFVRQYLRLSEAVRDVPGWPRHWFWGNLHNVGSSASDNSVWMNWRQFNEKEHKLTHMWLGPLYPQLIVTHCSLVPAALKLPKDPYIYDFLLPWLGEGLLLSKGEKWQRNRRLLTSAFHFDILKPYVRVYNSCLEVLIDKYSVAANQSEPVQLFNSLSQLTLDILLQCSFSCKTDCQRTTGVSQHPYIAGVYELSSLVVTRVYNPLYHINWVYFLTPSGWRMKRICGRIHTYAEEVIRERRKTLCLDGKTKPALNITDLKRGGKVLDFLDVLLLAHDEEGEGLTDLEIRNEVDTFMFEGHDTTTSGMSWTLYLLAQHPEHQERVREEVRDVLAGREWLEYEDLKELKYTHLCIKEALRLYPPVYEIYRVTDRDVELGGRIIPKGMSVAVNVFDVHRHHDTWAEPDKFNPLRFLPENCKDRDPFAFIPFSASLRNCIGQNFALNEERVVIATVIHHFYLTVPCDQNVILAPDLILRTRNDIKLNLKSTNVMRHC